MFKAVSTLATKIIVTTIPCMASQLSVLWKSQVEHQRTGERMMRLENVPSLKTHSLTAVSNPWKV